jgi:hypothetical protein
MPSQTSPFLPPLGWHPTVIIPTKPGFREPVLSPLMVLPAKVGTHRRLILLCWNLEEALTSQALHSSDLESCCCGSQARLRKELAIPVLSLTFSN